MEITGLSLGPLGTNCYIISKDNQALIIDPSGDADKINFYLNEHQLTPIAILLTHAHFDHIGALDTVRKQYKLPVYIHKNEFDWLENPELNRSIFMGDEYIVKTDQPDKVLEMGELTIGPFNFEVVHTPGHSPGSVAYIFHDEEFVVSGDVLFHQGIGRTDLPDGSLDELANSILQKLYTLPDSFTVYPGHGIQTTIGSEKENNPFTKMF